MEKSNLNHTKVRKSRIHGTGVFAKKDIPKGTKIIEYVGYKVTKAEADRIADIQLKKHKKNKKIDGAVYIFSLNKRYDLDGNVSWNTAKFINHSCNPNCETDILRGHIWIISTKKIMKGQEITYDYGYDFEEFEDHPCKCGSENCVGYIVEESSRAKLRRTLAKRKMSIKNS